MIKLNKIFNATTLIFSLTVFALFSNTVWATSNYDALYQSMKARQPAIEEALTVPGACLGERLDGTLEINYTCSDEVKTLAEAENNDRAALYQLMAKDLGIRDTEVGKQRALRYLDGYPVGVLRQVELPSGKTTWWNGTPPDPRELPLDRVLTLQYARIREKPDDKSRVVRDNLKQYEAFGVVGKMEDSSGQTWYKITEEYVPKIKPRNWAPAVMGWISEKDAIPWRRALIMRFTNAYQRDPSIFFKKPEPVLELAQMSPGIRQNRLDAIQADFKTGGPAADGVMAMEPLVGKGQEQIIMYPVLDFYTGENGDDFRIDGMFTRILEVAAQTRPNDDQGKMASQIPIDLVFVMDTTNSMKPYLQMVSEAIMGFAEENRNEDIRFGFIGYQDKDPAFEYQVRSFTAATQPAFEFIRTLERVAARETNVKGDDIPESVFEGIDAALDSSVWRQNAAKIIFLVGDAPGRDDATNIKTLRDKAFTRQIHIFAFNIKNSKVSAAYDRQTQDQYKQLSSTYTGAYGTSTEQPHLQTIDAQSVSFRANVLNSFQEAQLSFNDVIAAKGDPKKLPKAAPGSLSELIFQQAMLLLPDKTIPEKSVSGWVCDKVLNNSGREALAPMILLTETELEELDQRVNELKEIGEKALRGDGGTTLDFFDLVEKNTRFTMVNPAAANFKDAFSIPLGIDQLPYDSDIMSTTRDEFLNPDRVQEFVRTMKNKLRHYEDLRRQQGNTEVWKKLSLNAADKDRVVGVELNQLP